MQRENCKVPDRHEVEDVWHPWAVTQEVTEAQLEDYRSHKHSVSAWQ